MQLGLILLLIDVALIVHAAKTGRFWPWGFILLLAKAGRHAEAKTVLAEVLAQLKRAPKYVRRAQAEWIALAESALRDQVRA